MPLYGEPCSSIFLQNVEIVPLQEELETPNLALQNVLTQRAGLWGVSGWFLTLKFLLLSCLPLLQAGTILEWL